MLHPALLHLPSLHSNSTVYSICCTQSNHTVGSNDNSPILHPGSEIPVSEWLDYSMWLTEPCGTSMTGDSGNISPRHHTTIQTPGGVQLYSYQSKSKTMEKEGEGLSNEAHLYVT